MNENKNKNENKNIDYNEKINDNLYEIENNNNMSFFEKIYNYFIYLDKKIFGISGDKIFKKYKNEILLFSVIILIIVVLLFCYEDTNLLKQKGGDPMKNSSSNADKSEKNKRNSFSTKRTRDGIKSGYKYASKGMNYVKKPFVKTGNYMGGVLNRNKQYIKEQIYDIMMFMIIFIVFIPSLSFIIIILLSFRVLKPKISYIKSL